MLRQLFLFLILTLLFCSIVLAQHTRNVNAPEEKPPSAQDDPLAPSQDLPQDMLNELKVKRDENAHKQNVERAKESAQLSAELRTTYAQQKSLNQTDLKKLGRLEKLARQIRSEAGGSDDDQELKDPPKDLAATLARIADLAEELRKGVEKTPRQVVSASVISQANELIELIRIARDLAQ